VKVPWLTKTGGIIIVEKHKILIIDDDKNVRKTLADILKVKGYELFTAESGTNGLALLKQLPINLVIVDLGLSDMSGLEVLGRIKTNRPFAETIILTGNASLDSAIEATNKGAFSYLLKPYDIDKLILHIKRALEKQKAQEVIAQRTAELESINIKLRMTNAELTNEVAERKRAEEENEKLIYELKDALSKIKSLTGLLPICANCKKVRNDKGFWEPIEIYIRDRSEADFSHGICPECAKELYPEYYKRK